ncbi:MAG: UDP-glucuronic acid decarboxylase family protein [Anaerolineae bacterium]
MRVVVTGGAGFIGSHLVDRFLAEGNEVVAVDNLITGRRRNIDGHADDQRFTFIEHDMSEPLFVDGSVDAILHFASPASPVDFLRVPIQILKVNSLGTYHALGMARAKRARFLLASTSEVYGDPEEHPQAERYTGNVDPIGPRGAYDESKRFAEAITMAYHRIHEVDTRIVRIFNTYGPRMRLDDGRVVPAFVGQALRGEPLTVFGDGSQTRSFTYVSDLVDGIVRLLASAFVEPVNIGNPNEMTVLEFARHVNAATANAAGVTFHPLPASRMGDPMRRCPDISRATEILGWEPRTSLDEGMAETMRWFESELSR